MPTSFDFTTLFGNVLHSKGNAEVATSTLGTNGKEYVAVYFTASWCPPCRAFTPVIIDYYLLPHIQEKLDVIVVSSDREESAHDGYFAKMPWLSLPYVDRDRKKTLGEKFEVKGIPTLILLSASTGEIQIKDLRSLVEKDPKGHFFPYPEKSIRTVLTHAVTVEEHESFNNKTIALYFDDASSNTEVKETLLKAYNETKDKKEAFEVLQISWEKTVEAHATHASQVPWPIVAFDDKFDAAFHFAKLYDVEYNRPSIVVLDPARSILNKDATLALKKGRKFPFSALKVVDLNDSFVSNNFSLWEKPSLIVYLESVTEEKEIESIEKLINVVASRLYPAGAGELVCDGEACGVIPAVEPDVIFFTTKSKNDAARWYRQSAGLEAEVRPDAVLFDFNNGRKAFPFRGELTEESLVQFIEDFKSGKLKELKDKEDEAKKEAAEKEAKVVVAASVKEESKEAATTA
ncbi:UNVERIFIED_CONTAM: hypothetical protein HDU68_009628 [Siphonaria sp. JEL0065]|nr:hypothetical protein HDU68_009628 [Siphonaria sp. JEL0065]